MRNAFCAIALMVAVLTPGLACSWITVLHELDPGEQQIDRTPPQPAEASVAQIGRGRGPVRHENGTLSVSSCDDIGFVALKVRIVPKDDRTPGEKLGYRFVHVGGVLPENFTLPEKPTRLPVSGALSLHWQDGATDEQDSFAFAIAIIAVDLGGNESRPSAPIWVRHSGSK